MARRQKTEVIKPRLYKTIFEARYKPHLGFYNVVYSTAQEFANFPHWQTDRLSVTLRDFDKRCSLLISHDRFGYDQDSDSIDDEKENIINALEKLPKSLEISSYTRIGYRRQYLIPIDMSFQELVNIMYVKLFSQDEKLKEITPYKTDDLQYVLNSSDDIFSFHIRMGPVKKNEIQRWILFNQEHHLDPANRQKNYLEIIDSYPNIAVFIDIDIFRREKKIPISGASDFVEKAREKIENMVNSFQNYIFSASIGGR